MKTLFNNDIRERYHRKKVVDNSKFKCEVKLGFFPYNFKIVCKVSLFMKTK